MMFIVFRIFDLYHTTKISEIQKPNDGENIQIHVNNKKINLKKRNIIQGNDILPKKKRRSDSNENIEVKNDENIKMSIHNDDVFIEIKQQNIIEKNKYDDKQNIIEKNKYDDKQNIIEENKYDDVISVKISNNSDDETDYEIISDELSHEARENSKNSEQ